MKCCNNIRVTFDIECLKYNVRLILQVEHLGGDELKFIQCTLKSFYLLYSYKIIFDNDYNNKVFSIAIETPDSIKDVYLNCSGNVFHFQVSQDSQ